MTVSFAESVFVVHFAKLGYNQMAFGFIMGTSIILCYTSIMLLPVTLCFSGKQHVSSFSAYWLHSIYLHYI